MYLCRAYLSSLARNEPAKLMEIVGGSTMPPALLSFAAEVLAQVPGDKARAACLSLLDHPSALVREGALLSLSEHLHHPGVRPAVEQAGHTDPSPGVRGLAQDLLVEDAGECPKNKNPL